MGFKGGERAEGEEEEGAEAVEGAVETVGEFGSIVLSSFNVVEDNVLLANSEDEEFINTALLLVSTIGISRSSLSSTSLFFVENDRMLEEMRVVLLLGFFVSLGSGRKETLGCGNFDDLDVAFAATLVVILDDNLEDV